MKEAAELLGFKTLTSCPEGPLRKLEEVWAEGFFHLRSTFDLRELKSKGEGPREATESW
jgi:hypothetical protein